jgi:hypothetical protein
MKIILTVVKVIMKWFNKIPKAAILFKKKFYMEGRILKSRNRKYSGNNKRLSYKSKFLFLAKFYLVKT